MSQCVQILKYVSNLALKPGPATDAVLKLLTHQYTSLTSLTKYFILRPTKTNPAFRAVRYIYTVVTKQCHEHFRSDRISGSLSLQNCILQALISQLDPNYMYQTVVVIQGTHISLEFVKPTNGTLSSYSLLGCTRGGVHNF
jgi:hypothetical protein